MANRPISFEFVADVSKYLREVKKLDASTDDILEALTAVSTSGDDLERKLGKAMRDAAKDAEVLERAVKDVPRATEEMADKADDDFDRMGDSAREAGRDVGGEFRQSLGEALGSGGDLGEVVTETLGEAVSGLAGPVGAAAGVIAGGALLIFNQVRKSWEETQQAIADQTSSMWDTILSGIEGKVGESFARINKETVITEELDRLWHEDPEGMLKLVEAAEDLGIAAYDVVRARAGDEDALKRVKGQVDEVLEATDLTTAASVEQIDAAREIQGAWELAEEAVGKTNSQVEGYNRSVQQLVYDIPREIPIKLKVDASSLNEFSGGAYAISTGGRLTATYGDQARKP